MKKSHIILAAVPVVCALGGFGAGTFLKGSVTETAAHHGVAPKTTAEGALHALADDNAHGHDTHAAPVDDHGQTTGHDAPQGHDDQHSANRPAPAPNPATNHGAMIVPAAYTASEPMHDAGPRTKAAPAADHHTAPKTVPMDETPVEDTAAPAQTHRLDPDKLAAHAKAVRYEKMKDQRRRELEAKMAAIEKKVLESNKHPSLLPVDVEARITEDAIKRIAASEDHVVKLGRITLPVESASKVTYYIADFGVAVTDLDQASYYYEGSNAARLRDQVMLTLHALGPTQLMRPDRVDSDKLAERVSADLRDKFTGVEDFLFLSLYKTDVPRS